MKRILFLIAAVMLSLTLAACGETIIEYVDVIEYVDRDVIVEVEKELAVIPAAVLMADLDGFIGRPDVQYIDLRNFDDKMKSGYISGFEMIPFFDYLEYSKILVRTDGNWTFDAADIRDEAALRALFSPTKTIFLMCASGTRAGYVKAALESLGYTKVINVGGIGTYAALTTKANYVFGDGSYNIDMNKVGNYIPGTYYGYDTVGDYLTVVVIGPMGGIVNVMFDAVYGSSTKQNAGFDYGMVSRGGAAMEWFQHADKLAAYIVAQQGWGTIVLDEASIVGYNAMTVPHHFIEINHTVVIDGIAGVTIGAEGFVLSWNDAISQASATNLGVVATTATAADWAAAHAPYITYTNGTYYGYSNGYSALITISGNEIISVYLDTIHCVDLTVPADGIKETCNTKRSYTTPAEYKMNYTLNDNGTPLDLTDDFYELNVGKLDWWMQADELSEAIIDAQEWTWTLLGTGKFDVDGVAGVSITVSHWQVAIEEALLQATPIS